MITGKLQMLAQMLRSLAASGEPLNADTVTLVAHALENMLPSVAAMEDQPIPPRFRVIAGGRHELRS